LLDTFFQRGLWERVIEEAKIAIEVFGDDTQYFNLMLGKALTENGNLSDAVRPLMLSLEGNEDYSSEVIAYLDKILEIDKSNIPAHFARGRALSKAQRIDEAVEEFLLTVRILPARAEYVLEEIKLLATQAMSHPKIFFALGTIEIHLHKTTDAVKHLIQACELDSDLVKKTIPLFERLEKESPSPLLKFSLAKIYHLANLKTKAVKYFIKAQSEDKSLREPAITELKKICHQTPQDIESRKGLAEIYCDFNNLEDTIEIVGEVYKLDTKEAQWAKSFTKKVLEKNAEHIPSYYLLAKVLFEENDYKRAIEVYKKLIEISPVEMTKVIEILDKNKDDNPDVLLYVADLHNLVGDAPGAVSLYDRLFAIDPNFGVTINDRLEEILTKNHEVGEVHLLQSKIFTFQKEYEKAIKAIKMARQLMPEISQEIILKEGQIYFHKGEAAKAIEIYSQLLNTTKDRRQIYRLIKKTRDEYFNSQINSIKGDDDNARLKRAKLYILMNKITDAERELDFVPQDNRSQKDRLLLKAKAALKRRPLDALGLIRNLPIDTQTASLYAEIYEALGAYQSAASVLRQAKVTGAETRIATYERLAQSKRQTKGKYLIEGRL